jgi:hypothetical protein
MKRFFELTFKPFFVVTGLGTAAAGLAAIAPRWAVETMLKTPYVSDYAIFVQHWGVLVGVAGLFMLAVAFRESWRTPVLLYTAVCKTSFVLMCIVGATRPYASSFAWPAVMDASVVVYIAAYFWATSARAVPMTTPARSR